MDPTSRLKIFALFVVVLAVLAVVGVVALVLARLGKRRIAPWERRAAVFFVALGIIGLACFAYGTLIEVNRLVVTHERIETAKLPSGERLRIVHLSDLHLDEATGAPFDNVPSVVNALEPDLVVFTGDSLNEAGATVRLRSLLSALNPRLGRYAVRGNHDVWYWQDIDLFGGGVAEELTGPVPTVIADGRLALCGAHYDATGDLDACLRAAPEGMLTLVAYHTPDLVEDLAPRSPDLYLAGHTHGGQVRIPFYGAVITFSRFDKKYEMGRYQVGPTTLFVSRGIGVERKPAPRVRFLAPPEVVLLEVIGTGGSER